MRKFTYCPFCKYYDASTEWEYPRDSVSERYVFVLCGTCEAQGPKEYSPIGTHGPFTVSDEQAEAKAIARWNRGLVKETEE